MDLPKYKAASLSVATCGMSACVPAVGTTQGWDSGAVAVAFVLAYVLIVLSLIKYANG